MTKNKIQKIVVFTLIITGIFIASLMGGMKVSADSVTADYEQLYTTQSTAGGVKITGFNKTYFDTLPKDSDGYTLVNLVIPSQIGGEDVVEIDTFTADPYSFFNQKKVKGSLTFENDSNLEIIKDNSFIGMALTGDLILPDSITYIGSSAFDQTEFNGTIKLPNNPEFKTLSSQVFMYVPFTTLQGGIPSSVEVIEHSAFAHTNLTGEVVIPDSVIQFGTGLDRGQVFNGCDNITKVTLSKNIEFIGLYTFQNCSSLKEVVFPEDSKITHIGEHAFSSAAIEKLVLPNSVTNIHYSAFIGCSNLTWFYTGDTNFVLDGRDGDLFWGNAVSFPTLHVICKNEAQANYMKDRVYDDQDRCVTYEMTVTYDGLSSSNDREVLWNFPLNYKKADDFATSLAWEVESDYTLPGTPSGKNGWAFSPTDLLAVTSSSNVIGDTLYSIYTAPTTSFTFSITKGASDSSGENIEKVYDGEAATFEVIGKLNGIDPKPTSSLEVGDYFYGYNWQKRTQIGFNETTYEGMNGYGVNSIQYSNSLSFTNVLESHNEELLEEQNPGQANYFAKYYVRVYLLKIGPTGSAQFVSTTPVATYEFEVDIQKATPEISFPSKAVVGTDLESLADVVDDVGGDFTFELNGAVVTTVQQGSNSYDYTFVPDDTDNYNTVVGNATIFGVDLVDAVSVGSLPNIDVDYGTDIYYVNLPSSVTVLMNDGTTKNLYVIWDTTSYSPTTSGNQTFAGTLVMPDGYTNTSNLKASLTLVVGKKAVVVDIDDFEIVRGMPMPTFTATSTEGLITNISYSTTAVDTLTAGSYEITMTNIADYPNYEITINKGTLEIKPGYIIGFDSGGGSKIESVSDVAHGDKLTKPATTPSRVGYNFSGWYLGADEFDFNTPIIGDIILSAKWEKKAEFRILDGNNQTIWIKEPQDVTFTSEGELENFLAVYHKGELVDPLNYDVVAGSVIITLKEDYVATFPVGTYEFTCEFTNGTSYLTLHIKDMNGEDDSPKTGDYSNMWVYVTLSLICLGSLSQIIYKKNKSVK